jgi:hypothetical protein
MTASANTSAASSTATSTSVRIVARIRPVLGTEIEEDAVVSVDGNAVVMPNPKNEKETFTFPFHVVYGMESDQATIFAEGLWFCSFFFFFFLRGGEGFG